MSSFLKSAAYLSPRISSGARHAENAQGGRQRQLVGDLGQLAFLLSLGRVHQLESLPLSVPRDLSADGITRVFAFRHSAGYSGYHGRIHFLRVDSIAQVRIHRDEVELHNDLAVSGSGRVGLFELERIGGRNAGGLLDERQLFILGRGGHDEISDKIWKRARSAAHTCRHEQSRLCMLRAMLRASTLHAAVRRRMRL